ncbi:MAG: AmmeMemoRadiSam system radical SAM enzyme [Candidatus Altiarchaeales archaeon]|nr:AmmeMemoRadiSam system radical SAM enzyme [Candidatus Altiarchaeales archaeon]
MDFLDKKIDRRGFLKAAGQAAVGLGAGWFLFNNLLSDELSSTPQTPLGNSSRRALFYRRLGSRIRCEICPHQCVLSEGEISVCRVKTVREGRLVTYAYGNPCAVHIDPVEKKPLYHFLPESRIFSIATAGCNLRCLNCQNWEISQKRPAETRNTTLPPAEVVQRAKGYGCKSIAYTYSEPIAFYEYMLDSSVLAKRSGVKNVWVTAGYINQKPLKKLCEVVDAANVDLKGFNEETYNKLNAGSLRPVLETLKTLKKQGVWLEVTNLIVPRWTDDMDMIGEMCAWMRRNLGSDVPLHFSRFHPAYKLTQLPPTPTETLKKARETALEAGLEYVYIGNLATKEGSNTYCPSCGKIVLGRRGYEVTEKNLQGSVCKFCGEKIAGVFQA